MKRWTLAVSVLALLVAMGAGALTGGVLYMDRPAAVAAVPVAQPLVNSSQLCLGYRSQVLTMRLRGVYAKQMIDIFNLEMVTMNSKGQLLANRSPASPGTPTGDRRDEDRPRADTRASSGGHT
jgi:hypothetical protein